MCYKNPCNRKCLLHISQNGQIMHYHLPHNRQSKNLHPAGNIYHMWKLSGRIKVNDIVIFLLGKRLLKLYLLQQELLTLIPSGKMQFADNVDPDHYMHMHSVA